MENTKINFEKFSNEAANYFSNLANDFGHPDEQKRTLRLWRAVMHSIRDRIHIGESLDLIGPMPMLLKAIYIENWKYSKKPILDYDTMEIMKTEVKKRQNNLGEEDFPWNKPTEKLISITLDSLRPFLPKEQIEHILGQMPKDIKKQLSPQLMSPQLNF